MHIKKKKKYVNIHQRFGVWSLSQTRFTDIVSEHASNCGSIERSANYCFNPFLRIILHIYNTNPRCSALSARLHDRRSYVSRFKDFSRGARHHALWGGRKNVWDSAEDGYKSIWYGVSEKRIWFRQNDAWATFRMTDNQHRKHDIKRRSITGLMAN
jgi:hypothetical protein